MTQLAVGPGTQITLHFALKLERGEIVDSNFEGQPATFVFGDGNLLPGFEKALLGLTVGAKQAFTIAPKDAFGQPNPNNIQTLARESFAPDFELAEGLVVGFSDAAGAENPAVITEFDDTTVTVDFNHPLAGKMITFEVEILSISPAVTH